MSPKERKIRAALYWLLDKPGGHPELLDKMVFVLSKGNQW
jgi:hypothetical protein